MHGVRNDIPALMARVVLMPSDCWEWQGARVSGYGRARWNGTMTPVHRIMYEHFIGTIPQGLDLDHLCRNRACVNPFHLEAVTRRENLLRGQTHPARNAAKTHCPQGHSYDQANTHIDKQGQRHCRRCGAQYARRYRRRRTNA